MSEPVQLIMSEMMAKYQAHHGCLPFVKLCINGVLRVAEYKAGDYLSYEDALRLKREMPCQVTQGIWIIEYPLTESGEQVPESERKYCTIIESHFTGWREEDAEG